MNELDSAAKDHDIGYSKLQEQGLNPYFIYNQADQDFQERIKTDKSFEGNLARGLFQLKKNLFPAEPQGGSIPEGPGDQADLPGESAGVPSGSATEGGGDSESNPRGRKRNRGDRPRKGGKRRKIQMAGTTGQTNADPPGFGLEAGDPHATDSWHNSAHWGEKTVTTAATRVWVLPSYDNHLYKKLSESNSGSGANRFLGWSTPWGYFDFNRFNIFFSPRNWQRLINNYTGFRPKSLRVRIHQVQLKEVSNQNGTTQIATSLSSTVQVLADELGVLPYVMASATEGSLSPFPNEVTILPQYGYTTTHYQGKGTGESAYYCLEGMDSTLLKTGDEIEFTYQFPDLPFHSAYQVGQFLHQQANPLLGQYLLISNGTNSSGTPQWKKPEPKKWASMYQNNLYGPAMQFNLMNINDDKINENYPSLQQVQWEGTNPRTWIQDLGWVNIRPGPASWSTSTNYIEPVNNVMQFDCSISRYSGANTPKNPYRGEDTELVYTNAPGTRTPNELNNSYTRDGATEANQVYMTKQHPGGNTVIQDRAILPGMSWMDRDVYLCGPIWGKIPNTDGNFHPTPLMGGFGCKKPPPMILIKNTPTPANPPTSFQNDYFQSYLTEYSTGLVTLELTWELDRNVTPRWNPDIQYTYSTTMAGADWFWPDDQGRYHEGHAVGTRYQTTSL